MDANASEGTQKNILSTHNEYILEPNKYLSCTSEVPQRVYEAIGVQSVEMGFIFFLLSLTPLVPCGLHTHTDLLHLLFLWLSGRKLYILCQTSLKRDKIWLLSHRPALTMPLVSPYKGLPCYPRLDETKFKRLKTGAKGNMMFHRVRTELRNRAFSLHSFVKQAWAKVMTVLSGIIIGTNTHSHNSYCVFFFF